MLRFSGLINNNYLPPIRIVQYGGTAAHGFPTFKPIIFVRQFFMRLIPAYRYEFLFVKNYVPAKNVPSEAG